MTSLSKELIVKANITLLSGVLLWAVYKWLSKRRENGNRAMLEMNSIDRFELTKNDVNIKVLFGSVTGKSKVAFQTFIRIKKM